MDLQLRYLHDRLAAQKIGLIVSDAAKDYLAREGYDPNFGARPLRRLIQREVENRIATLVLSGELKESTAAVVDFKGGELRITVRERLPAAASDFSS